MRKIIRILPAFILFTGMISIRVNSQDIDFTLFNYNPLFLNPANTGNFIGDWRLGVNYRNQWAATANPFQTASLSFDTKFNLIRQKFGAGLYFVNDESGEGGLKFNKIYASIGYQKELAKNYFNIGFQIGYVFGSINDWETWNNITKTINPTSGEENFKGKVTYPDLNAGISWKKNINIFEPEIGVSLSHINTPKNSFVEGNDKEEMKYVFHSNVKVKFNDKIYLAPTIFYMNKVNTSLTIVGSELGYNFIGNFTRVRQVFGGVYLRNGLLNNIDSYSLILGTSVGRLDIAFSYDNTVSDFGKSAGNMGAYEISIIYKSISTLFNTYSIPCERY